MFEPKLQGKNDQQSKRVLVALGHPGLGDAVEAFPVYRMIREHWPDVYLAVACSNETQEIIVGMAPDVSARIRLKERFTEDAFRALKHFLLTFKAMRGFDHILILRFKRRVAWPDILAAKLTGAQIHHNHGLPDEYFIRRVFPDALVYQMMTARMLDVPLTTLRYPEIPLTNADRQFAKRFFEDRGLRDRPRVVINAGTYDSLTMGWLATDLGTVSWGIENFVRVANALVVCGVDVLFNGGTDQQMRCIESARSQLADTVVVIERPTGRELAAIISECDLLIGDHSGPVELASAVGTPAITMDTGHSSWGPSYYHRTGPVWWPRRPSLTIITKADWCKASIGTDCRCMPSTKRRRHLGKSLMKRLGVWKTWKKARRKIMRSSGIHGDQAALITYPCLEAITVQEVVEAAKRVLSRTSPIFRKMNQT